MSKYLLKDITRKSQTSLSQLKNWCEKGLIRSEIFNQTVMMDDRDILNLYKIKSFHEMGFTLDSIKIILDNISEKNTQNIFKIYNDYQAKMYNSFFQKSNEVFTTKKSILSREYFGGFKSEVLCRPIMFELYDLRKVWYLNQDSKVFLKKMRRCTYAVFMNYACEDSNFIFEIMSDIFTKFYNFLVEQGISKESWLHFICWFKWLTNEPRYIREMKRIAGFNYSIEIFDMALRWIILKTN